MQLGNKVKVVRELKNYSQQFMAESLGITQASYSKMERSEVDINVNKAEKIAKILGVELADLVSFNEKEIFNIKENFGQAKVDNLGIINNFEKTLINELLMKYKQENEELKQRLQLMEIQLQKYKN